MVNTTHIGNIKDFTKVIDIDKWNLVGNGHDPSKYVLNGIAQLKSRSLWNEDERKKHLLSSKVR